MNNIEMTIAEKGYLRVIIKPKEYRASSKSFVDLKKIMVNNAVNFRGWDFPHVEYNEIQNMSDWIEMSTDWMENKEYWKLYLSGQFAFKSAFREDFLIEDIERNSSLVYTSEKERLPHKYLSILSWLYKTTEIFEFASRLIDEKLIENQFTISISLFDTNNRMLFFWDRGRHLRSHYICKIDRIDYHKEFNSASFSSKKIDYANDCTQFVFERFNWDKSPGNIFHEEQLKLIEKRL